MKVRKLIRTMAALVCAASVSAAGACSAPLGLPTRGDVTTLAPIERQDRRVYTVPDGPEADAQPESCICLMVCVPVCRGVVDRVAGEKLTM